MSATRVLFGVYVKGSLGILTGAWMGRSWRVDEYLHPVYVLFRSIPPLALITYVMPWVGHDQAHLLIPIVYAVGGSAANIRPLLSHGAPRPRLFPACHSSSPCHSTDNAPAISGRSCQSAPEPSNWHLDAEGESCQPGRQAAAGQMSAAAWAHGTAWKVTPGSACCSLLPQSWTTEATGRPAYLGARDGRGSLE